MRRSVKRQGLPKAKRDPSKDRVWPLFSVVDSGITFEPEGFYLVFDVPVAVLGPVRIFDSATGDFATVATQIDDYTIQVHSPASISRTITPAERMPGLRSPRGGFLRAVSVDVGVA